MVLCSAKDCDGHAIAEIWIKALSPVTKRKYLIQIYVCSDDYKKEKDAGGIMKEKRFLE